MRTPAEWERHAAIWTAWPSDPALWEDNLAPARTAIAAMVRALAIGERVHLLAGTPEAETSARAAVEGLSAVRVQRARFGDIWLRDTGPIMTIDPAGDLHANRFGFNGWGGKYALPGDTDVGVTIADAVTRRQTAHDWILEGGAIDTDGTGLAVTTEQCLLNPNRNPGLDRQAIEERLDAALGLNRILWLGEGLAGDHTDGHVDNLARFVAPATLALPVAAPGDPNAAVYADARARAAAFGLRIVDLPSPGRIETPEGEPIAASYMNFVIGNAAVVLPTHGVRADADAAAALKRLFPTRRVAAIPATAVLTGGGAFHCITQQVPAA